MAATREIPTPYLIAGGAALVLGVLATPLRRVLFSAPVLTALVGAALGRKEGKEVGKAEAKAAAPKRARRAPAKKAA